jgi:hypothetical protein
MRLIASTTLPISLLGDAAATADGTRIAVAAGDNRSILVLDASLNLVHAFRLLSSIQSPLAMASQGDRIGVATADSVLLMAADGSIVTAYPPQPGYRAGDLCGTACAFSASGEHVWLIRKGPSALLELGRSLDGRVLDQAPLDVGRDAGYWFVNHVEGRLTSLVAGEGQSGQTSLWIGVDAAKIRLFGARTIDGEMALASSPSGERLVYLHVSRDSFVVRSFVDGGVIAEIGPGDVFEPDSTDSLFGSPPLFLDDRRLLVITCDARWLIVDIDRRAATAALRFDDQGATIVPVELPRNVPSGRGPSYAKRLTERCLLTTDPSARLSLWDIGSIMGEPSVAQPRALSDAFLRNV